mmetsp:Transcript_4583/g.8635  ORF Transcript_4583/g.8635 Transcript_4583/m.8635 type:complete len:204 (+) Transcript_4583:274-885(+)|eukprot:CAMPEP_0114241738 /NCGR_PEP_ID=MMETSP0058-20121206/9791_1 /TAXON_ID=36894 /ORGANISM="Pyramimonas parkeae, CCMP726" /LENGTH=203 /DNA_ID=CAMNT_0001354281 /DNA_START=211 /DNA_END=822 /DNA_ORIENTATION=-
MGKAKASKAELGNGRRKPTEMEARAMGKQFMLNPPKKGKMNEAFFNPFERFLDGEKYDFTIKPDKQVKAGFLSSGNVRRDDSLIVRRCEVNREFIRKDHRFMKAHPATLPPLETIPTMPPPPPLFDLVYEKHQPSPNWDREVMRLRQDTKNPARLPSGRSRGMHSGFHKTSNVQYGHHNYNNNHLEKIQHALPMKPAFKGYTS